MTRRIPVIFWIVLLSFLIRFAFIVIVPPTTISLEGDDAAYYHLAGLQMKEYYQKGGFLLKEFLAGHLFKGEGMLEKYGLEIPWVALKKGPLYPVFVGLFFWLAGPDPFWVFVAQALLVSLAGGLLYGVGRELGQERAGLFCALLFGIYPPFIFIVYKLFQESLSIFLFALFYFLVFRCIRTSSLWLSCVSGIVLFLLSLSKSRLVFFPFFLFAVIGATYKFVHRANFPARNLLVIIPSFLIPYLLWTAVVSWQLRRPAMMLEHGGIEVFSGVLPDYDGWTPDSFLAKEPEAKVAEVLKREGILEISEKGNWIWPSDSKLIGATLKILWRHPWISLRMAIERFQRLWWFPFDWPWKEFLYPPELLRWFHRFVVVAAMGGLVLWGFERPFAVWFLTIPLIYGVLVHCLFHCENRYVLPFLPFLFPFASFFTDLLWRQREILLSSLQKFFLSLGIVFGGGAIFRLSQPAIVLKFLPDLNVHQSHLFIAGIQCAVLTGFFVLAGRWFRSILPGKRLLTSLGVSGLLVGIPFANHSFNGEDWKEWKAQIQDPRQAVRQEIFLPTGSLQGAIAWNLKLDLLPPPEGSAWTIDVNGKSAGTLETLKSNPTSFLLAPPYLLYLPEERKKPFEKRQWFSVPLSDFLLREGALNTIEIRPQKDFDEMRPHDDWTIFGDYPTSASSFRGPLFQRSPTEISVFKFQFSGDARLEGVTALHHQGVKSSYRDGRQWRADDLSSSPGIQRGEYRMRIEAEHLNGQFVLY